MIELRLVNSRNKGQYIVIKKGTLNQIDKYTSKYDTMEDCIEDNVSALMKMEGAEYVELQIEGSGITHPKLVFKNDIEVFNMMVQNHAFVKFLMGTLRGNFSEFDRRELFSYRYAKHMERYLVGLRKKDRETSGASYYEFVVNALRIYKGFQKRYPVKTVDELYASLERDVDMYTYIPEPRFDIEDTLEHEEFLEPDELAQMDNQDEEATPFLFFESPEFDRYADTFERDIVIIHGDVRDRDKIKLWKEISDICFDGDVRVPALGYGYSVDDFNNAAANIFYVSEFAKPTLNRILLSLEGKIPTVILKDNCDLPHHLCRKLSEATVIDVGDEIDNHMKYQFAHFFVDLYNSKIAEKSKKYE